MLKGSDMEYELRFLKSLFDIFKYLNHTLLMGIVLL